MTPSPPHSIFVKEEFWMTLIVHNVKFRLQEIYTKFSDLWNAKIDKKNMHKKKITQNNIYVVWQFVYVYGIAMILLFTRKNIRGGNTVFLSLNNMPKNTNL